MRQMSALLVTLSLLLISATVAEAQGSRRATASYWVSVHCMSCQEKLVEHLRFERGVRDIDVLIEEKRVDIVYNSRRTDPERLGSAIERLGYEVKDYNEFSDSLAQGRGCCSQRRGSQGCSGNRAEADSSGCKGHDGEHKCTGRTEGARGCCKGGSTEGHKCSGSKSEGHKCSGSKGEGHRCGGHSDERETRRTEQTTPARHQGCGQGAR